MIDQSHHQLMLHITFGSGLLNALPFQNQTLLFQFDTMTLGFFFFFGIFLKQSLHGLLLVLTSTETSTQAMTTLFFSLELLGEGTSLLLFSAAATTNKPRPAWRMASPSARSRARASTAEARFLSDWFF
jgi:hypothetical protein